VAHLTSCGRVRFEKGLWQEQGAPAGNALRSVYYPPRSPRHLPVLIEIFFVRRMRMGSPPENRHHPGMSPGLKTTLPGIPSFPFEGTFPYEDLMGCPDQVRGMTEDGCCCGEQG